MENARRNGEGVRGLPHDAWVADALAEVFVSWVVGEAAELVLDRLRQWSLVDVRVLGLFARELRVEVGRVQHGLL